MSDLLYGVRAKIGRADEHLETFRAEAVAFGSRQPYRIVVEPNEDSTQYMARVDFTEQPPLTRWSLVLGDAVHNLRCALDHLVYALAIFESGQDPPPRESNLQFVIAEAPDDFAERRRHIKSLSQDAQAAIQRLQPYNRPQTAQRAPLLLLDELDKIDKHRLLQIARVVPGATQCKIQGLRSGQGNILRGRFSALEDGTPFVVLMLDEPTPGVKMKFDMTMAVAVRHSPGKDGLYYSGVDWVIEWIRDEVGAVVEALADRFTS